MISALVCFAALNQKAPTVDYSVMLGASTQFHETVYQVKTKLAAKDFQGASSLAKILPQSIITYRFNYGKVPKDLLESYKQSTSFAIASWQKSLDGKATLVEANNGVPNVLISFEPVLQKTPDTNEIPGVALFYGATASEPRVEVVIGLKRTAQLLESTPTEVFNEVAYGIGSYLGLASSPVPGSSMGRVNGKMVALNLVSREEGTLAEANLRLAKALRVAALAKTVVKPTRPQLAISDPVLQFKPAFQGDTVYQFVTVTNKGDAPLLMRAFGDCSCISGDVLSTLKPGESTALKGRYRTEEIVGDIEHNVVLISNDPEKPSQKIPAKIHVEPRAEIIFPTSDTLVLDGGEKNLTFYVHSTETIEWQVLGAQLRSTKQQSRLRPLRRRRSKLEGRRQNQTREGIQGHGRLLFFERQRGLRSNRNDHLCRSFEPQTQADQSPPSSSKKESWRSLNGSILARQLAQPSPASSSPDPENRSRLSAPPATQSM